MASFQPAQPQGVGTDIVSTVADAATQLQRSYINSRFSSAVDEWPPYQPKHYTTLAFIHNKDKHVDRVRFSVTEELAVAGRINSPQYYKHSNFNVSITKRISDIFLPIMASDGSFVDLYILIEGAPGIGKTVLAKEIAYQWAKNELLTSKRLLLLVFLRDCHQTQLKSIESLVQHVFKHDRMTPCLTDHLLKTEGNDSVVVFDGFDELSEENKQGSIIVDIINRKILTKCCLVVTSRPTASSGLHGIVDRRVEIVGFTEEDRLDYIKTALKNNNVQVEALQHYLRSNPTINALCYIPLNMTILLCLAEEGIDTLPKTQTEMYKNFIQMTIVRFIKKYGDCKPIIRIDELTDPHDKVFIELTRLAYEALKTDDIVFTLSQIQKACPNLIMTPSNWNGLGLLKAVCCFSAAMGNNQVTFHFLHFSIQEYMAALHISTLPDNEQIALLEETFWEHRYYNTWIMYAGITGGSSFALRHFLSGNSFKWYSKLLTPSKVSKKYLKDKMKCLHLFQCFFEANKEEDIKSMEHLFKNNIDLSNQTLLPIDLNTLGFFLIRSINKNWDELNLSNCNIGCTGSNILCDRLTYKDTSSVATIKIINFSYNQLNAASAIRLCSLFNFWHTSELLIFDDALLLDVPTDITAIEEIVLQSHTLSLVFIGSYLFSKKSQKSKILHILLNTASIQTIYLLNCSWEYDFEFSEMLGKQPLSRVRVINSSLSSLNEGFIKTLISVSIKKNNSLNIIVYDATMFDEIADDICKSIYKDISGVLLIVSRSKIQGIVNTHALSDKLSALELFNLATYVRYFNSEVCLWTDNLKSESLTKESIHIFVEMLYVVQSDWQLKINVVENNVLILHKLKFKNVDYWQHCAKDMSIIYLSDCNVTELEYHNINISCSVLYCLNSPGCVELLHTKLLHEQSIPDELFICGNVQDGLSLIKLMSHYNHDKISAVLAANNILVGLYPNLHQIGLAFQLQPSPTRLVLCSAVSAMVFYQLIDALVTLHTAWIDLDLMCCNVSDIECEVLYRSLAVTTCSSTVRQLNISFNKLSVSGVRDLVEIIIMLGIQELCVDGTNNILYDCLINNFTSKRNYQNNVFLSITYNNKLVYIVCMNYWNEVVKKLNNVISGLCIINCELHLLNPKEISSNFSIFHKLSRLCLVFGTVSEAVMIEITNMFMNTAVELSVSNVKVIGRDAMLRNLLGSREFYYDVQSSLLISTDHWLCVCNATKYQLHFIHQYFINQTQSECYGGMNLISKLEKISGHKMYIFENDVVKLVRFHATLHQTAGIAPIAALGNVTSLNTIEIDNYSMSSKTAGHLANILQNNTQLQEIYLNKINTVIMDDSVCDIETAISHLRELILGNNLQTSNTIKIMKSLQKISSLTKLCFCSNNITDKVADDIAAAISCNIHLQELNLGNNNLQTSGIIIIARTLQQKISSLTKLYINHNNITDEAADDIGIALHHNSDLQEVDIGGNYFKEETAMKISTFASHLTIGVNFIIS